MRVVPSRWNRLSRADAKVENIARLHAIGIVIVVLLARERSVPPCGSVISFDVTLPMVPSELVQSVSGLATVANTPLQAKPMRHLLIRRKEAERGAGIGHAAHHQTAVISDR